MQLGVPWGFRVLNRPYQAVEDAGDAGLGRHHGRLGGGEVRRLRRLGDQATQALGEPRQGRNGR